LINPVPQNDYIQTNQISSSKNILSQPQYTFAVQKENISNMHKNSETSSFSAMSDREVKNVKHVYSSNKDTTGKKLFNSSNRNSELNKKRQRYIKNNKFVYVHPGSAAAKKMELEKQVEKLKEEENIKPDQYEDLQNDFNLNNMNNQNDNNSDLNLSVSEPSNKGKKPRGSRYRGVSRNGNQWQVLIMVNKKKRYVGSYSNEEEAARAYDKVALQNHGTKAKTNFDYVDEEVKRILGEPPLLKLNN
jgi:hypothetical protein